MRRYVRLLQMLLLSVLVIPLITLSSAQSSQIDPTPTLIGGNDLIPMPIGEVEPSVLMQDGFDNSADGRWIIDRFWSYTQIETQTVLQVSRNRRVAVLNHPVIADLEAQVRFLAPEATAQLEFRVSESGGYSGERCARWHGGTVS